jgi:hypothetical protein
LYAGYDDNVLFSSDEKISSSVINIEPSIELDYRTLRSSLEFSADFDILRFLEASDLDRVNQYYRLNANYQLGERWDVRAGVNYFNDTTLNTYLEETGRVINRVGRDYLMALGGLTYKISNSSWLDTYYQYEKATYDSDIFSAYDRNRLNLYYSHRLKSERDVLSVGPSFYHRNSDVNDTDYISLDVVWDKDWSEITKSSAGIGPRYTMVDNDIGDDENVWGVKAKLDITHLGIASKLDLRYFHDLRTLAAGTDVNVDNLFLSYNYSLTQRFNLGIQGRLIFSYSLFELEEDTDNENRFYSIEPFLGYQLLEN